MQDTKTPPDSDSGALQTISVQEAFYRDQEFYWQRFASFAVIHAGLFVLAASNVISCHLFIHIIGVLLAGILVYIQILSLVYVDRLKPQYHDMFKKAGLQYSYPGWFEKFKAKEKFSSTDVGVATTVIVLFLWILLLATG